MQNRPELEEISLDNFFRFDPGLSVTMSVGQWDDLLQTVYDLGCILVELNDDEKPIRAYRKTILKS